ncbi:hypothetical protein HGRIS_012278 [Hohenbuehelia grisea]|uniref:Uncharacterized protein n=1 Tax=Hohenbuehelia grisea TaxID=104357 RepID=A0ABR3IRV5_9AGAR
MKLGALLAVVTLSPLLVHAANDWRRPCFDGQCSYDLRKPDGSVSATLKLVGSPDSISDITPAAGWTILGCDPDAEAQDIRLVCTSGNATDCRHLYRKIGAAGKLVRLPDNCGKSAFARVARNWVHKNQTIPSHIRNRLARRGIETPQVQGLQLDTNFAAIDHTQLGTISLFAEGTTIPGANGNLTLTQSEPLRRRHHRLAHRGFFDGIKDGLKNGADLVGDALSNFNKIDVSKTADIPAIDVNKNFPVFSKSLTCPSKSGTSSASASVSVSMDTTLHAVVQVGFAAHGTLVPPSLDSVGLFAGFDADFAGSLNLAASASGTIDSGVISFFEAGLPGLDFPKILSIGPVFKIQGQAKASLQSDVNLKLGMAYSAKNAKLYFPASKAQASGGNFSPGNSPLKLSVDPSISVKGSVEAHLIPRIEFGITALGAVKSTVFLDLDAYAALSLTLNARAAVSTAIGPTSSSSAVTSSVRPSSASASSLSSIHTSSSIILSSLISSPAYSSPTASASTPASSIVSPSVSVSHYSSSTVVSSPSIPSSAFLSSSTPYVYVSSAGPASSASASGYSLSSSAAHSTATASGSTVLISASSISGSSIASASSSSSGAYSSGQASGAPFSSSSFPIDISPVTSSSTASSSSNIYVPVSSAIGSGSVSSQSSPTGYASSSATTALPSLSLTASVSGTSTHPHPSPSSSPVFSLSTATSQSACTVAPPVTVTVTVTAAGAGGSIVPPSVPSSSVIISSAISSANWYTRVPEPSTSASPVHAPVYSSLAVDIAPSVSASDAFTIETAIPSAAATHPAGGPAVLTTSAATKKCKTRPAGTTPTTAPAVSAHAHYRRHAHAHPKRSASASVDGCVEVTAGFDVRAGADASFFGLFNTGTQVSLFSKKFEVFKKCFGASTAKRDEDLAPRAPASTLVGQQRGSAKLEEKRDLGCLLPSLESLIGLVDEPIPASSIQAI